MYIYFVVALVFVVFICDFATAAVASDAFVVISSFVFFFDVVVLHNKTQQICSRLCVPNFVENYIASASESE